MPYPIPTEHQRRAVFAWLKRASSLRAWRRLYTLHQVFVDTVQSVYEEEQRTPGAAITIPTSYVADLLRDHDAFAKALDRLARGDRRCFLFLGAPGHFNQGLHSVWWWNDMVQGLNMGRNGFGPFESPRWPELEHAMENCLAARLDIMIVLQSRFTDVPAPLDEASQWQPGSGRSLIEFLLDQPTLPPVPVAEPELLVETGRDVPCFGVWEPVKAPKPSGLLGALRDPLPAPPTGRELDGCMNYLHADNPAPTIQFPEDGPRQEGRRTTWRLLWRDQRYEGAPAPVEEDDYVFVR